MNQDDLYAIHEALRTEDGQRFPAVAYAYVPDRDKPSTWKVRLWESVTKKTTRKQLGRVSSAFSPGGFRGKRVQIPVAEAAKVKSKIRAVYKRLGVSEKIIPRWVKERNTMSRLHAATLFPLDEKAYDAAKGEITLTVIRPGFNTSKSRFYPKEVLARDAAVFAGAKMFKDHATKAEEKTKPEGSVDRYAGDLGTPWVESDGSIKATAKVTDPVFKEKLKNMSEGGTLKQMGVSIRAIGAGTVAMVEGAKTLLVESIVKAKSVDFVTYAGAGGQVELFESAEAEAEDLEVIDETQLRKARPDLVELIESAAVNAADANRQKGNGTMGEIEDLKQNVATLTASVAQNAKDLKEATDAKQKAEDELKEAKRVATRGTVQTAVAEALSKVKDLPEPAKARVKAQFTESDSALGILEAIEAERAYIKEVTPKKKTTGFGEGEEEDDNGEGAKTLLKSFTESYISAGNTPEEAKRKAEIAAR